MSDAVNDTTPVTPSDASAPVGDTRTERGAKRPRRAQHPAKPERQGHGEHQRQNPAQRTEQQSLADDDGCPEATAESLRPPDCRSGALSAKRRCGPDVDELVAEVISRCKLWTKCPVLLLFSSGTERLMQAQEQETQVVMNQRNVKP